MILNKTTLASLGVAALATSTATAQFTIDPATNVLAGTEPSGVAAGDFDGDGDMDLATTVDNPERIVVLLNDGAGNYSMGPSSFLGASSSPQDLIAGQLDGVGGIDLAVAIRDPQGSVLIMSNQGGGTFAVSATVPVGDRPRGLDIADIDGDGDMDLAVANRDGNSAHVIVNNGGVFNAMMLPAGNEPRKAAFGDFDGDGDQDVAVTNHDDRTVSIYTNNGGVFASTATLFVGALVRPEGITSADLDGNGTDDLAVATSDQTFNINQASVFTSVGGAFSGPFEYPTGGQGASQLIACDLDCDDILDLAVVNQDSNSVSLLQGVGGAAFGAPQTLGTGTRPGAIVEVDIDGDGDADLATDNRDSNNISVFRNQTCPAVTPCDGDLDDDGIVGILDLLTLLGAWGPNPGHPADIDNDGTVSVLDLLSLLGLWGTCP